jgi:hypothetical protein
VEPRQRLRPWNLVPVGEKRGLQPPRVFTPVPAPLFTDRNRVLRAQPLGSKPN